MEFDSLSAILKQARVVPELTGLLGPDTELYLVGGALRDLLLGRPVADLDFAGPFDPTPLARAFAGRTGGHWFVLDAARHQSRVVLRSGAGELTCDFAPFRADGLEADLRLRDFTVNALAVRLLPGGPEETLIDPLGGEQDLREKSLRACSAGVFADDPLRVLKGVRHAVTLGFVLEAATAALMRAAAGMLPRVAPERVRAEVAAIFAAGPISPAISLLDDLQLLPLLFGPAAEGGGEGGGREAGLQLAAAMEAVLQAAAPAHADLLADCFESGLTRAALLRLAAFLRGWRPAQPERIIEGLRLGRRAGSALRHLLSLPAERSGEAAALPDSPRAQALWAASLDGSVPDSLLFLAMLAPQPAAAAWRTLEPVLASWLRLQHDGRIADLVDGAWLREHLGLAQGPAVGHALAALRREEVAGRVRTPEEGKQFLREWEKSR